MIRILRFLLTGDWHLHEWETKHRGDITDTPSKIRTHTWYDCRCKHCGKWKCFKI